ncbi:MAG: hypothetical protein IBJ11_08050 [Phycisphaerales bacterium]|nr:hypothetical protein [Phycisphaerales bacterium]
MHAWIHIIMMLRHRSNGRGPPIAVVSFVLGGVSIVLMLVVIKLVWG